MQLNNLSENLLYYNEYFLMKDKNIYKIIVVKRENEIIINSKFYEIIININDLNKLTKSLYNSLDEAYEFFINIFEENKVFIKEIIKNKKIKLILQKYIDKKQEEDIELILVYNKINKNIFNNEIIYKYIELENNIKGLNNEIQILKKEINKIKLFNTDLDKYDNKAFNEINTKIKSNQNPKDISFSNDLIEDSYANNNLDNTFSVFKSINNILYLIFSNENRSIISYNLIDNKKINEIKNAHKEYIINFRHQLDKLNKRDLILSISADDNNIKLWNVSNWQCLLNLENVNNKGRLYTSCFLKDKNQYYIITSNANNNDSEPIKIFDFNGNKIKEINNSNNHTFFVDNYYDNLISNNYIITGNIGYVKSYDYNNNIIYHTYDDNDNIGHLSAVIYKSKIIKLIESSYSGNIRIWNFHSGLYLSKIKIINEGLYGICLWNDDYLFIGAKDKTIKLINFNEDKFIKSFVGHKDHPCTIKKLVHPKYGECFISQNWKQSKIKIWIKNNY